jgi:hypothetical protein
MGSGDRRLGRGRLTVEAMFSLEPVTMHQKGSLQLFQTGETFKHVPLMNYQHPHDLVMGLGATFRAPIGRVRYTLGADIVGSPTLGPTPFMHRESGRDNPQVPLLHHYLDASHSTPGVLRAGLTMGPVTIESSVFRGVEPDENRLNIEAPHLDSWAVRTRFDRGPWHAQFSGVIWRNPKPGSRSISRDHCVGPVRGTAWPPAESPRRRGEYPRIQPASTATPTVLPGEISARLCRRSRRLEVAQKEVLGLNSTRARQRIPISTI